MTKSVRKVLILILIICLFTQALPSPIAQYVSAEDNNEGYQADFSVFTFLAPRDEYVSMYQTILNAYENILNGKPAGSVNEEDISIRLEGNTPDQVGLIFAELNGDGIPELITGYTEKAEEEPGNVILDMYTYANGGIQHLGSSWLRGNLYLTEEGYVYKSYVQEGAYHFSINRVGIDSLAPIKTLTDGGEGNQYLIDYTTPNEEKITPDAPDYSDELEQFWNIANPIPVPFVSFSDLKQQHEEKDWSLKFGTNTRFDVVFKENAFSLSSYIYQHDLAQVSLCLELSSMTPDENATWGETEETMLGISKIRAENILEAYDRMGFEEIELHNYGRSLNESADKVAYSFAKKELSSGAVLIPIVIRGGGYGNEWVSNFNVGRSNFHSGFNIPAKQILNNLHKYLDGETRPLKIWITGYSRAAAVGNLLAGKLDNEAESIDNLRAEDIFTYTFATPQGVKIAENPHAPLYNNIFSFVNPADMVPRVPPSTWGYERYGITRFFNINASDELISSANQYYKGLTGHDINFREYFDQTDGISAAIAMLTLALPSEKSAIRLLATIRDFLDFTFTHTKDAKTNSWHAKNITELSNFLRDRYGAAYEDAYAEVNNYLTLHPQGLFVNTVIVPNEKVRSLLYDFLTLLEINGISCRRVLPVLKKFVNIPTIYISFMIFFDLADHNIGSLGEAHFPEQYLTWLSFSEDESIWIKTPGQTNPHPENNNSVDIIKPFVEPNYKAVYGGILKEQLQEHAETMGENDPYDQLVYTVCDLYGDERKELVVVNTFAKWGTHYWIYTIDKDVPIYLGDFEWENGLEIGGYKDGIVGVFVHRNAISVTAYTWTGHSFVREEIYSDSYNRFEGEEGPSKEQLSKYINKKRFTEWAPPFVDANDLSLLPDTDDGIWEITVDSKQDLKDYLGTNIYQFADDIGDLWDEGISDGMGFTNNYLIGEAPYGSDQVQFLLLTEKDIGYSLYGVYIGMPTNEIAGAISGKYEYIEYESEDSCSYIMNNGSNLYIYLENSAVKYVSLKNQEEWM